MRWQLLPPPVAGKGIAQMYTTAGGKPNARISIAARTSTPAGRSTPASVGIAAVTNASVVGSANMSVLDGDGGEVVATSGHIPAATSEYVAGINGVAPNGFADGAVHVVGNGTVLPGLCAGGRNLVR